MPPLEAPRTAIASVYPPLNIRPEAALRQSPSAAAVWETFVFAQLRHRERRKGRAGSLFFWRDLTREVDFVADVGGWFTTQSRHSR